MEEEIKNIVDEIKDDLINIRRRLHSNPELSLKEYETSEFIYKKLKEFGIKEVSNDIYKTAVLAIIRGKKPGKTILLRADMDALPIDELNNCSYKSINKGIMHACGHDGHVTWMLGTAYVLNKLKDKISGNIKILFQPAEEDYGGADELLKSNDILISDPKVDYAIAGHVWPEINSGEYGIVNGRAMAAANKFIIEISGRGGHGAEPHKTIDPIAIANQVYMSSQQIISRRTSPFSNAVLTIGKFIGNGSYNVISSKVIIEGTIRAESYDKVVEITNLLESITKGITESQGAQYTITCSKPIKAVINDENLVVKAKNILSKTSHKVSILKDGSMTGEDFCYFSTRVPSLFIYVGTKNIDKEIIYPLHSPRFNFDEDILESAVNLFAFLAINLILE
ncbi:amidohydrolase [Clostridium sp. DSM 100503]|uniref:M20 metallopeptidase family protein n=1 Tax=Clostridium sp. DSM 100503 TaxID=2963282 RepID=UPI0021499D07|nr:amidohydrolase [Clostridium sp. DSM 100503]MCR1949793.1 amidohydrolase [Clostridium sp. DSM 100503]